VINTLFGVGVDELKIQKTIKPSPIFTIDNYNLQLIDLYKKNAK
jgi:hypothetical protein